MPDHARRANLLARAKDLRSKTDSLISKCHDDRVKRMVKRSVTHWVDDVESYFLGQHSDEHSESAWLNSSTDTFGCRRILKNSGGPISRPPCSGIMTDRPSPCVHRSWLPV